MCQSRFDSSCRETRCWCIIPPCLETWGWCMYRYVERRDSHVSVTSRDMTVCPVSVMSRDVTVYHVPSCRDTSRLYWFLEGLWSVYWRVCNWCSRGHMQNRLLGELLAVVLTDVLKLCVERRFITMSLPSPCDSSADTDQDAHALSPNTVSNAS